MAQTAAPGTRPDERLVRVGALSRLLARPDIGAFVGAIAIFFAFGYFARAVNWLGDSLDGTLARVRQKQRPRYGFYLDHMLDSIGSVALMGGLAFSGYMSPLIAMGLLVSFLLLSVQSYLATYTVGEFRMSFWSFGPTELRILLAAGNLALFRWPRVLPAHYRLFDVGGAIGIAGMMAMLLYFAGRNTVRLYKEERL